MGDSNSPERPRCVFCSHTALDGHLTCGCLPCDERAARDLAADTWRRERKGDAYAKRTMLEDQCDYDTAVRHMRAKAPEVAFAMGCSLEQLTQWLDANELAPCGLHPKVVPMGWCKICGPLGESRNDPQFAPPQDPPRVWFENAKAPSPTSGAALGITFEAQPPLPYAYRSPENSLRFLIGGRMVLSFEPNGDVLVRGEKVDSNRAIYEQVRAFFAVASESLAHAGRK
jgi:hypothetical protein